jgi:hypothetical protein
MPAAVFSIIHKVWKMSQGEYKLFLDISVVNIDAKV